MVKKFDKEIWIADGPRVAVAGFHHLMSSAWPFTFEMIGPFALNFTCP
jgi:hypothetical protein